MLHVVWNNLPTNFENLSFIHRILVSIHAQNSSLLSIISTLVCSPLDVCSLVQWPVFYDSSHAYSLSWHHHSYSIRPISRVISYTAYLYFQCLGISLRFYLLGFCRHVNSAHPAYRNYNSRHITTKLVNSHLIFMSKSYPIVSLYDKIKQQTHDHVINK